MSMPKLNYTDLSDLPAALLEEAAELYKNVNDSTMKNILILAYANGHDNGFDAGYETAYEG